MNQAEFRASAFLYASRYIAYHCEPEWAKQSLNKWCLLLDENNPLNGRLLREVRSQ
jgi:hypothetical protein